MVIVLKCEKNTQMGCLSVIGGFWEKYYYMHNSPNRAMIVGC